MKVFKLNDRVYDVLKWITLVVIPACTTFYSVVAPIFGWYSPETVAKISAAVCALIGAIIGISTAQYNADRLDK